MAKTVQSSETNVGAGSYQQTYWTDAISEKADGMCLAPKKVALIPNMTDEKKLFFATVYGESAGQKMFAWAAVASTIMNRVNNPHFKYGPKHQKVLPANVTEVIENGGYDAYQNKTPLYNEAITMIDDPVSANRDDLKTLISLMQVVSPIYLGSFKSTDADLYFSPKAEWEKYHLKWPKDWTESILDEIFIPGVDLEDFRFFKYKGEA